MHIVCMCVEKKWRLANVFSTLELVIYYCKQISISNFIIISAQRRQNYAIECSHQVRDANVNINVHRQYHRVRIGKQLSQHDNCSLIEANVQRNARIPCVFVTLLCYCIYRNKTHLCHHISITFEWHKYIYIRLP